MSGTQVVMVMARAEAAILAYEILGMSVMHNGAKTEVGSVFPSQRPRAGNAWFALWAFT